MTNSAFCYLPPQYAEAISLQPRLFAPLGKGLIKLCAEDFVVNEALGFTPKGQGEHNFVWVEKRGLNTTFVAEQLAKYAGIKPFQVGFSGLKDRHALTRQWFSLHLPGSCDPNWQAFNYEGIKVLDSQRHHKKLKRGVHRGNYFELTLRETAVQQHQLQQRIQQLAQYGFPNYFGPQRFGLQYRNLSQALLWFKQSIKPKRKQQGFYLSAARSFLFNQIVAERLRQNNWDRYINGDVLMLHGTNSLFTDADDAVQQRLESLDCHITASLVGAHAGKVSGAASEFEKTVLQAYPSLYNGLISHQRDTAQRAIRVVPQQLTAVMPTNNSIVVQFYLPAGAFATVLLEQLLDYQDFSLDKSINVTEAQQ